LTGPILAEDNGATRETQRIWIEERRFRMAQGSRRPYNATVELFPESEESRRVVFEITPTHDVRWIQCHRCRRRFWYALHEATPNEERWEWGKELRTRILGQPCAEHIPDVASVRSDDRTDADG